MNVIEWTIYNFSYWNRHVHEKQIECQRSGFSSCPHILLYPGGLSGSEEHIVVHVYVLKNEFSEQISGHLSFFDSSGSVLCIQEIGENEKKGEYYELLPNLKFADVSAEIRKSEFLHEDRFTLRCKLKWKDGRSYRLQTTIDVFDSSLKIDLKNFKEKVWVHISSIECGFDELKKEMLGLSITWYSEAFLIKPTFFTKNILVSTTVAVLKFGSVTRMEKNEHVFQDDNAWLFLKSLTKQEYTGEQVSLLLQIKVSPGYKYKHHYGYSTYFAKEVEAVPSNIFALPKSLQAAPSNQPENSTTVLTNELTCLYQDGDFSDFLLRCGEVSFQAHKAILSARSPVFKAMLSSDMSETASDTMDVADLDAHTLGRFLVFLYSGTVEDLQWDGAMRLYYAADKYQVPSLKRECFSVFRENVSVSNVSEILSLAEKHQDEELTKEAQAFILKNYNDVLRSDEWQAFIKNEPLLAIKTVTFFAKKNTFKII